MSSEGEATLAAAVQNLHIAWQEVRAHWRDAKALEFEEKYLKELPLKATQASTMMTEIEKIIKKVKNDCG